MTKGELGYSMFKRVFERVEMERTFEALARAQLTRTKAGARHVLGVPSVRSLAADLRLMAIAAQFVGPAPVAFRATLFDKSPAANWLVAWHQDTALPLRSRTEDPAWGPWSAKAGVLYAHAPAWALEQVIALRVHLDDSTAANGPLRILPMTHLHGVLSEERIAQLAREIPAVDCVAASGGVVAMRPLVVHASSKATDRNPRRVLHIEYAASFSFGRIQLAVG
jgi:ectoine hydroxylase-related dioxygenase (phytanoyl-CoA dioxygenase family)